MKRPARLIAPAAALAAVLALPGCVAPVGPVEVTRFRSPDPGALAPGTIAIEAAPGMDPSSLEYRSYAFAVARQLSLVGFSEQPAGSTRYVALIRLERATYRPGRNGGPVSMGLGGSTGSYGSGLGVGIGIDLSGPPPEMVETRLSVMIRDRASNRNQWEGRSTFAVRASSPLAGTQLGAAKMAEALFKDFPGSSGETIEVR